MLRRAAHVETRAGSAVSFTISSSHPLGTIRLVGPLRCDGGGTGSRSSIFHPSARCRCRGAGARLPRSADTPTPAPLRGAEGLEAEDQPDLRAAHRVDRARVGRIATKSHPSRSLSLKLPAFGHDDRRGRQRCSAPAMRSRLLRPVVPVTRARHRDRRCPSASGVCRRDATSVASRSSRPRAPSDARSSNKNGAALRSRFQR